MTGGRLKFFLDCFSQFKKRVGKMQEEFYPAGKFFEWRGTAGERPPNCGRLIAECGFSKKEAKLFEFVTVYLNAAKKFLQRSPSPFPLPVGEREG